MARLERRPRLGCRLPCEVVLQGRSTVKAAVTGLSEGGLGLEAALSVEQGDSIRLRILPHREARAIMVDAIVWNDRPARRLRDGGRLRSLGCVVSDPPAAFLELMAEVERRCGPKLQPPATRVRSAAEPPQNQADLPRSRVPLPPPKREPDESLPVFRVRLKQIGGPRTRIVSVHACSLTQAEERARLELSVSPSDAADAWEVLEIARRARGSSERGR